MIGIINIMSQFVYEFGSILFQVSRLKFQISGFEFQVTGFKFQHVEGSIGSRCSKCSREVQGFKVFKSKFKSSKCLRVQKFKMFEGARCSRPLSCCENEMPWVNRVLIF